MTIDTSNWDKVTLGDIAQSLTIVTKNPLSEGFERYVGLDHIEPGSIHIKSWGNVADGTTFTRVFRKGQVSLAKDVLIKRKRPWRSLMGYVLEISLSVKRLRTS